MASIHVIYDPKDRLEHRKDFIDAGGFKIAMLPVADNIDSGELQTLIETLSELLIEQVHGIKEK
jgi:hypothetical protein